MNFEVKIHNKKLYKVHFKNYINFTSIHIFAIVKKEKKWFAWVLQKERQMAQMSL